MEKETLREFYRKESKEHHYLPGYEGYDRNQLRKMTHLEHFQCFGKTILFDYSRRNALNGQAAAIVVEKER